MGWLSVVATVVSKDSYMECPGHLKGPCAGQVAGVGFQAETTLSFLQLPLPIAFQFPLQGAWSSALCVFLFLPPLDIFRKSSFIPGIPMCCEVGLSYCCRWALATSK